MIKAKLTIVDGPSVEFDATPCFELANQAQIDSLKESHYRNSDAANAVAEFCRETDPKVDEFFTTKIKEPARYNVEINQEDAEAWLAANPEPRPERVEADDAIVSLTEFLREVADLDDLAELLAKYVKNGPVQVYDDNGESEVVAFSYGTDK